MQGLFAFSPEARHFTPTAERTTRESEDKRSGSASASTFRAAGPLNCEAVRQSNENIIPVVFGCESLAVEAEEADDRPLNLRPPPGAAFRRWKQRCVLHSGRMR